MRVGSVAVVLGVAVAGCEDPGGTGPTGAPTGSSTDPATSTIEASCALDEATLRATCTATVDPPQPVDLVYWPEDGSGQERTWPSDAVAATHEIPVYLMKAETTYAWEARPRLDPLHPATGTWTTPTLGPGCAVGVTITGTSTSELFIAQSPCLGSAHVLAFDSQGNVQWCEGFAPGDGVPPQIDGTSLTEDGTLIAVVADTVIEKDFMGNELLRLEYGVDFDHHVHHDVFRKNGRTYVLFKEDVAWNDSLYVLDGFYVFEGREKVGEWHLFDHFQPTVPVVGLGPETDYSHANAIWQDDDGDLLIGFRHLSAIAKVVGDPTDPDFGQVIWRMAGDTQDQEFGNDFAITAPPGVSADFERQHNVHFLSTGQLTMFDNRGDLTEPSRLLHLDVDEVAGTAEITGVFTLPIHCDFQGGAWHTSAGNPVATCAPPAIGYEWDLDAPDEVRWTGRLSCGGIGSVGAYVPRFIPWDGPWGAP